ncbi:hypothetical protein AB0I28_35810 [Phytomonospora sp. NPDC050363]|uniref:hypothetical protein n=1 Tax=Phytomonospora sp. NPDC050363 TaxID=3155642 RepID=UPI0033EA9417
MNSTTHRPRIRWVRAVSVAVVAVLAAAMAPLAISTGAQAAFPGANGKIFYHRAEPGMGTSAKLYSMDSDGTGSVQLTTGSSEEVFPVASADGSKLAFLSNAGGTYQIWTSDADGSNLFQVTNISPRPGFNDNILSWSPSGDQIAFNDDSDNVRVVNADGTGLTAPLASGRSGVFSPDGTKIAYTVGNPRQLWVMNADGTGQTQLTDGSSFGLYTPDWSPDGTKLVARSYEGGGFSVRTINADGTGSVNLGGSSVNFPQWSPDGTKIVYTAGYTDIISMNADGTSPTTLLTLTGFAGATDWAPGAPPAGADLATTVSESADPVNLGGSYTYTATVTNNGPAAATAAGVDVTLTGATAAIGTVTSSQGSCTTTAPTVTCTFGALAVSASATVAITVTPTAAGTVTATSVVSADQTDPNPADNTDAESTTVNAYADINVDVGAQPHLGILVPYLTYTLKATNNGPQTATTATITASIPAGATATNLSSGCTATPGTVTCTYSAITNGANASKTFRVPLHLLSLGNVTVTGLRTTSAPTDTNATNDTDSATCHVVTFVLVTCS